jgi:predicted dehydrogenase
MIGILGSGFGLYGYLPAVARHTGKSVALPKRYIEKFNSRKELADFAGSIQWVEDETALLQTCDTVILSLFPAQQEVLIRQCLSYSNITNLVLEKPLAVSPALSKELLSMLMEAKKNIRIGYTFQYTGWATDLFNSINSGKANKVTINWLFRAHHYKNALSNWKRFHSDGGSVIRFYGIHCIALAAQLGYKRVVLSKSTGLGDNDIFSWVVTFSGDALPALEIEIDSNAIEKKFKVCMFGETFSQQPYYTFQQDDPFTEIANSEFESIDPRVGLLTQVIQSLFENTDSQSFYELYANCNELWERVENINSNSIVSLP